MTIFAQAVLGPDGRPLDQIRLTGVTATGHHGVLPDERAQGQQFGADVVLHLDTRPAAAGDALADTVSYADVAQDVHAVLAGSPADLVETVAERIAAAVLAHPAVVAVDVRVHKPQAPIAVPFDDVEVAIRRDRVKAPVVAAPAAPAQDEAEPFEVSAPSPFVPVASAPVPLPAGLPVPPPLPVAPPVPAPVPVPAHVDATPPVPPEPPAPEVDRLDTDPVEPVEVVLAIGANLGDAQATLRAAVTDLDRLPGIQVTEVSPLARTTAVGGPEDQPDYLNAVLIARTTLSPRALLRATQAVENAHGRVREERWGPRTLDVDIVRYGTLVARADDLELPHPRAHERAFVLVPWAEVQPDADLPGLGGGPVAALAETAPDRAGIRWLALDWLAEASVRTGSYPSAAPEGLADQPGDVALGASDDVPAAHAGAAIDGGEEAAGAPAASEPAPWEAPAPQVGGEPAPWEAPAPQAGAEPAPWVEPVATQAPPVSAPAFAPEAAREPEQPAPVPYGAPTPSPEEAPAAPFPPFPGPVAADRPGPVHTPVSPFAPVRPAAPAPPPGAEAAPEPPASPAAPAPLPAPPGAPAPASSAPPVPGIVWQPVATGSREEAEAAPGPQADDAERWIPYDPDKER